MRYDDDDYEPYDPYEEEARERREYAEQVASYKAMTPEQLGEAHQYQCRRHDNAVDRCEDINSPTIESAAGWMRVIEREFESRGLDKFKYIIEKEDSDGQVA